ncbi:hypothetical protein F5146DRAFT_994327 [Armillaria mellea]|nr:hypothetical protein F5146DRAFT_994327 [Armillaria mellea]
MCGDGESAHDDTGNSYAFSRYSANVLAMVALIVYGAGYSVQFCTSIEYPQIGGGKNWMPSARKSSNRSVQARVTDTVHDPPFTYIKSLSSRGKIKNVEVRGSRYEGRPLGGAFGGGIASAVGSLDRVQCLQAWRWLFIIEGPPSVDWKKNFRGLRRSRSGAILLRLVKVHTAQRFSELESKVLKVSILKQRIITKFPRIAIFQPLRISSSINTSTSLASSILKWIAELEVVVVVVLKGIKVKHHIKLGNCSMFTVQSALDERFGINNLK